jgi:putative peptidoglycan lipid II flippase
MAAAQQERATAIMWAAALVSAASVLSRLLGFFRDALIASDFGQTATVDQYNAAYVIPDTLYLLLIGGAISSAFVPVVSEYLSTGREDEAHRVVSIALNLVLVGMLPLVGIGLAIAPWLVRIIAVGFNTEPGAVQHTAYLTRIMLGAVVFHAVNGVLVGLQYARKSFWATAIGPLFYNIAIIAVGAWLAHRYGIQAFAWGVLTGAALNFVIQAVGVARLGYRHRLVLDLHHPGLRRIGRLMVPVAFGVGLSQLNLILNQTELASLLPAGSINALRLASRIMLTPVSLASSLAITLLPNLTELATERAWPAFRQYLTTGLRVVWFVTVPSSLGLLVLAEPVVAVLFRHGRFDAHNVAVTAGALTFYTLGIVAYGSNEILLRGFYALRDTVRPVVVGSVVVVVGFALNWVLLHVMQQDGLALAYSLVGYLELLLLGRWLHRRIGGLGWSHLLKSGVRILTASLLMGLGVEWAALASGPLLTTGPSVLRLALLLAVVMVGIVVYALAARRLHLDEYEMVARRLRRRFGTG